MNRLAVYCGSATPADPRYIELAREVGRTLAERGIGVVYGGGRLGLMGAIASAVLEAGGEVVRLQAGRGGGADVAGELVEQVIVIEHDEGLGGLGERVEVGADLADTERGGGVVGGDARGDVDGLKGGPARGEQVVQLIERVAAHVGETVPVA